MEIALHTQPTIEIMQLWDKRMGAYIPFALWPRQATFLDRLHDSRKIIVLKKRQVGLSQLTGADSLCQCMFVQNFTVLVLSKTGEDAREYLRRVREMYQSLPESYRLVFSLRKDTLESIEFTNGSRIISLPANRGAGYTANRVIIDDAAFITRTESKIDLATVLQRVEPTLDKAEGQLILISTANGLNTFQQYYQRAMTGRSTFTSFFFSCWDDPTFTAEKWEQAEKDHGLSHVNQEYPRTDLEAFLSSGSPRFSLSILEQYRNDRLVEPIYMGDIAEENGKYILTNTGGTVYIRQYCVYKPRGQYMVVADVAEGLAHGDYSVAKVFDMETWEQVLEWHGHIEHMAFGIILVKLGRIYNNAVLVVEANNHGASTITQIRNEEYYQGLIFTGQYLRMRSDDDFRDPEKRLGWLTTTKTKKASINRLAYLLGNKDIPTLSSEDIDELQTYVIDSSGHTNAEEGCFDDRVMVLAIAYYLLSTEAFNADYPVREFHDGEDCINCNRNNNRHPQGEIRLDIGICKSTKRSTKRGQVCGLFRKLSYSD